MTHHLETLISDRLQKMDSHSSMLRQRESQNCE